MRVTELIAALKKHLAGVSPEHVDVLEGPIDRATELYSSRSFICIHETSVGFEEPQDTTHRGYFEYEFIIGIYFEKAPKDHDDYAITRAREVYDDCINALLGAEATGYQVFLNDATRLETEEVTQAAYEISITVRALEDNKVCR